MKSISAILQVTNFSTPENFHCMSFHAIYISYVYYRMYLIKGGKFHFSCQLSDDYKAALRRADIEYIQLTINPRELFQTPSICI